jgi:ubiquitin carboxyl-terminal hydrolase 7
VITDDTFRAHGGTDLTQLDQKHEVNPAAPRAYRVLKKSTLAQLIDRVAEDTGCDPRRLRFWHMVNRQNKTSRPDLPLSESLVTIEDAQLKLQNSRQELRLWAELADEVTPEGEPIWQAHSPLQKSDIIVLFLKYFDLETQSLSGAGHIYISREKKIEDLVPVIMNKMGWPGKNSSGKTEQLKLFEVAHFPLTSRPLILTSIRRSSRP